MIRQSKALLMAMAAASKSQGYALDTVIELFRKNKKYVEDYIDRNGKMATICGVPVHAVGGSWDAPRRKDHVMFVRR